METAHKLAAAALPEPELESEAFPYRLYAARLRYF